MKNRMKDNRKQFIDFILPTENIGSENIGDYI
jgi:hypothetical protein